MAETKDVVSSTVQKDPNFAVICSFLNRYGALLGLTDVSFEQLEKWIDDTRYVNDSLKELLIRLLKYWRRSSVNEERLQRCLVRFCHTYSDIDAWELEGVGFQRCKVATKLRVLKNLLEVQFDLNGKFKDKINAISADELRSLPLGRDVMGKAYWFLMDNDMNMRIYCEEQDDVQNETWQPVVTDRNQLLSLIASLREKISHANEKSRSATPSTIESDVASVEVCTQSNAVDGCVSEASSDAALINAVQKYETPTATDDTVAAAEKQLLTVKVKTEAETKLQAPQQHIVLYLETVVKSESDEHIVDSVKVKNEPADAVLQNEKDQQSSVAVVGSSDDVTTAGTDAAVVSTAETCASDSLQCKTEKEPVSSDDKSSDVAKHKDRCDESHIAANDVDGEIGVNQTVDIEVVTPQSNKTLSHSDKSDEVCVGESLANAAVNESDVAEQPVVLAADSSCEVQLDSCSHKKSKKPVSKPERTPASCFSELKTSVKRKRAALCRSLSTSSEEGGATALLSESDLSDSVSAESRSQSAGEEEPPTKRKREKALKTAAERDRRSGRGRLSSSVSPATKTTSHERTTLSTQPTKDINDESLSSQCTENQKTAVAKDDIPTDTQKHNAEETCGDADQSSTVRTTSHNGGCAANDEQCGQISTSSPTRVEECQSAASEHTMHTESRHNSGVSVCDTSATSTETVASTDTIAENSCAVTEKDTAACATESTASVDEGTVGNDQTDMCKAETNNSSGATSLPSTPELEQGCTTDKCSNSQQTDNGTQSGSDNTVANKIETTVAQTADVTQKAGDSDTHVEVKCNGVDDIAHLQSSNDEEQQELKSVKSRKKTRSKSVKKGRKKRGHSKAACAVPAVEIQETDGEPRKKLGRPSKKSRVAQLLSEGCDSLTASEDDIPLIELRRSSRANKGQRKVDLAVVDSTVVDQPRKRIRAKELEKDLKRVEKEEKRQKREAELQEAALKAKKKKRGKSDSDDEFVPGKKNLGKRKGRGAKKKLSSGDEEEAASSDATDDLYDLLEPESEDELIALLSSSENELNSDDSVYIPRGRNAKRSAAIKQKADTVEVEEQLCIRCGKATQPEWILLCDRCDSGYHTACLRPPIMLIPDGDWFCPLCEHNTLIEKLQEQLAEFDRQAKLNARLMQRKERLAYVTVNLSNVIPEGERRQTCNLELYDDEASAEEESKVPAPASAAPTSRKRHSPSRRDRLLTSSSSSLLSSSDGEDELPQEALSPLPAQRHTRRRAARQYSSESDEDDDGAFVRRSCRRRKDISYKFEEFDQLINVAIEDDVKDPESTPPKPRHSGKDMSNITGLAEMMEKEPSRKKHTRKLTGLDTDDTQDDSEEFHLSEGDEASSADEDADVVDDESSEDWSERRAPVWGKPARRSNRPRQRSSRMRDFVSDESDGSDDDGSRRKRRAAQQRVNYHEISESESATSNAGDRSPTSRRRTTAMKQSRVIKHSDSDYHPSSDAEVTNADAVPAHTTSHKRLGSSSDEGGSEAISKKKGRLNRIMSSSDYDSSDDEISQTTDDRIPTAPVINDSHSEAPLVNGKCRTDVDYVGSSAASQNNKGFTIDSLLKSSSKSAKSDDDEYGLRGSNIISDDDSLSGIEDLVDYVTQS